MKYQEAREAAIEHFERDFVASLLMEHDGNVSKSAREAEMDRVYLHRLMKRHGFTSNVFRDKSYGVTR